MIRKFGIFPVVALGISFSFAFTTSATADCMGSGCAIAINTAHNGCLAQMGTKTTKASMKACILKNVDNKCNTCCSIDSIIRDNKYPDK